MEFVKKRLECWFEKTGVMECWSKGKNLFNLILKT